MMDRDHQTNASGSNEAGGAGTLWLFVVGAGTFALSVPAIAGHPTVYVSVAAVIFEVAFITLCFRLFQLRLILILGAPVLAVLAFPNVLVVGLAIKRFLG